MSSPVGSISPSAESPQISSEEQQQKTLPEEKQQVIPEEQQIIPEEQQQTLFNLRVPRLMNTISNGKRVPHMVLAFPFDIEDRFRCAVVNNIRPDLDRFRRQTEALTEIRRMLPRHCDVDAIRYKNYVGFILAVIVASNATPRSLALMHDIDRLRKVQRILGTNECPRWSTLNPDEY